jgi:guanylate kinase
MWQEGLLLVLSGPSGVGKGTVSQALRQQCPNLTYSVSVTTRQPREGEKDGVNYFFKSREDFEALIRNNELLEWAEYAGNFYGTPLSFVNEMRCIGRDVLLEIEVQGALRVKKIMPDAVFLFLAPPSMDELRARIESRGTESEAIIHRRLSIAREELEMMHQYHYLIVNDKVELAVQRIQAIITAEHLKMERYLSAYQTQMRSGST